MHEDVVSIYNKIIYKVRRIKEPDKRIQFLTQKANELSLKLDEDKLDFKRRLGEGEVPNPEDVEYYHDCMVLIIKRLRLLAEKKESELTDSLLVDFSESQDDLNQDIGHKDVTEKATQPPANKEYLNVKEVAALIGCPESTIYKWTSLNTIPFSKLGQRLVFNRADIVKWIAKKKHKPIE